MDHLQLAFLPEEHLILRSARQVGAIGHPLIVAVSGGLDSVTLLHSLYRLKSVLKSNIYVAHIHHGRGSVKQTAYRNHVQKRVKELALSLQLPYVTNMKKPQTILKSEEQLRDFRYGEFAKITRTIQRKEKKAPFLVLAHHQDDLIETQLLRLVRGTGRQGLIAMEVVSQNKWRPLLSLPQSDIKKIAKKLKIKWTEDPSNYDLDPRRNWMRHVWIPSLEKKIPGAKACLARSLAHLAEKENSSSRVTKMLQSENIKRQDFLELSLDERKYFIANYLKQLKVKNFTSGHITEICKQLDNSRTEYTFTVLKHEWCVNAERIQALKI